MELPLLRVIYVFKLFFIVSFILINITNNEDVVNDSDSHIIDTNNNFYILNYVLNMISISININ